MTQRAGRSTAQRGLAIAAGLALLGLMIVHAALRPEHAWVWLATCDIAALATAVGLVLGWDRCLAAALVFQVVIGLPAFALGLCTTYAINVTGVAIHVVPPILGVAAFAGRTLPPRAALSAWLGYVATVLVSYLAAPPRAFNINFTTSIWRPVAGVFSSHLEFYAALFAVAAVMLALGERGLRRALAGATGAR